MFLTATFQKDINKMKIKKELGILLVSALVLYPVIVVVGNALSNIENPELSEVSFYVS